MKVKVCHMFKHSTARLTQSLPRQIYLEKNEPEISATN